MHQRDICLCPACIRRDVDEAPEEQRRAFAKCWVSAIAKTKVRRRLTVICADRRRLPIL
jgi:hypothetical protein